MDTGIGLLIGLIGIALAIFFGLSGFSKSVSGKLSSIEEKVIRIDNTAEKAWDLVFQRFGTTGTVERSLKNLGKVNITAEPGSDRTAYLVQMEKPVLKEATYFKVAGKGSDLVKKELELLGEETKTAILTPARLRIFLPSTDPKTCTQFMNFFLRWLDSTYIESLKSVRDFEEPILPEDSPEDFSPA